MCAVSLAQNSGVMLISQSYFSSVAPSSGIYNMVNVITADQQHTSKAVQSITTYFTLASTQTVSDALKSQQDLVDTVKKLLDIAGLLALLIGGIGIVNTMQVLLSRRKIEIAMLKTNGYRRVDLYLLFGLEAGLLGLIGGAIGSLAAVGISYLVRGLVQQTFRINIPFVLDPMSIGSGVLIGLVTALIFGLMPIVQASNIRPLNVIRELPGGNRAGSTALTIGLLLIVSALFCLLSIIILNSVILGIGAVYGTFIFLGLLSLFFIPVVFLVGKLPVLERFNLKYLGLLALGAAVSVLIALFLPTFGYLMLAVTLMGFVVVLLPRSWKSSTKMALRNIGRQRARTTTTLLALFVGIFAVGLILLLGLNVRDTIDKSVSSNQVYNVGAIASKKEIDALQAGRSTIPGLSKSMQNTIATTVPVSINSRTIADILKGVTSNSASNNPGRQDVLSELGGVQGFDVANSQFPELTNVQITGGRSLNASDADTNTVLIPVQLANLASIAGHINLHSTLVLASADGKQTVTLTVVGIYSFHGVGGPYEPLLTTTGVVQELSQASTLQSIFYMKIDPHSVGKALAVIDRLAPNALIINQSNITSFIDQFLNYILLTLITIAGLSLLAGIIIIANAVALAMLERRRELGILKSVGYTSSTVLSEVLIENGVIGGLGATLAMMLAALAINVLGRFVFNASFSVNSPIVLLLILGAALLAMITAALVAYGSVRVRPLEVLRYE
jgi:ABC-type antimicrobial peptide transport system permease subunit